MNALRRQLKAYHQWIVKQINDALKGKTGEEAKAALSAVLKEIRDRLAQEPRLPYIEGGLRP